MGYDLGNQEAITYRRTSIEELELLSLREKEIDEDGRLVSLIEQIDDE